MFLTHKYDLKIKSWSKVTSKSKKGEFISSCASALLNKNSKSEIFTPKFQCVGSIWTVLAGPCKKSPKNPNYDFFGQQELMIFKNISTLKLSTKPLTAGDFLATLIFSSIFPRLYMSVGT
jgi:hypothetical protein